MIAEKRGHYRNKNRTEIKNDTSRNTASFKSESTRIRGLSSELIKPVEIKKKLNKAQE
jgi:hypothetical protein